MAASSHTPLTAQQPQLGLRERKKLKTRTAIRRAALGLIAEQGYEATTIEQIAEASEFSPSTVFRYFPTKEDIVLTDEYDPVMASVLRSRPAGEPPLESIRFLFDQTLQSILTNEYDEAIQRTKLMIEVPAVRARMTETMAESAKLLGDVLAERTGRAPDDLELRLFIAAMLGVVREVTLYWGEHGNQDDLRVLVRHALDSVADGLRL
ncbi:MULTISPECIES: TetR/AcrR family transcriptional regulator [unclassified Streptomyces]|uniref:TetR/AcrR family transcriptional regulator n=1 Tax=unclassified Streptomyces TaxID=2593676 RepID=UPI003625AF49